jgi:hypothetical protein
MAEAKDTAKVEETKPVEETNKTVQKRSASDALKASDFEELDKQKAEKLAAETLARAESEENLNWGQIAKEPPVIEKANVIEVAGGTETATVIVNAFSVIDENKMHNSFVKGDRIKISQKAFDRGVALGALKK